MKQFEFFGLDTSNECLWRNGAQIPLPPKPFAVLRYLVENPGRLITHDELLDALWPETYVQPQVLRTYVLELRKLLGDDAGQPRFIQTLTKRGYCFVAAVTDQPPVEPSRTKAKPVLSARAARLVGREQELSRLNEHVTLLASEQRRVVFVTGEAGIGKTALVDAFCQQLDPQLQASVARGQCVQGVGCKEEYYPVMEALSQLCVSTNGELACRTIAKLAPAWLALGRETGTAEPAAARPALQERLVGDLCAALEEMAAAKPLILVFEDLHWADESTLNLISALARRRAQARLMVLATCMPRKGSAAYPQKVLKQDLLVRRLCVEMALAPLPRTAVCDLLSLERGQEPSPGLTGFVFQHSEGNPLFVIAILEHMIAQRFLVRQGVDGAAQWEQRAPFPELPLLEAGIPDKLEQMIELEIERLSPEEQHLLEAGSLMSVAFPAWAVAAALEKDAAEIEEACDALARRLYFVERAGQDELPDGTHSAFYVFAHGLYREVLYQRQAPTRRAKRQIRIADRLGELFAGRSARVAREMAVHYEAAGDWKRAADALRAAALHAHERRAYANAAELLQRALHIAENLSETERAVAAPEILGELIRAQEAMTLGAEMALNLSEKA
jgi:predicted ATPase